MPHVAVHAAVGLAFAPWLGPWAVVASMAPDVGAVLVDAHVRRALRAGRSVEEALDDVPAPALACYRLTHAAWWPLLAAPWLGALAVPWLLHLALDACTHVGPTAWRPLGVGPAVSWRRRRTGRDVVLLSGGIDSAAVLSRAVRDVPRASVLAVFVDYGQPYAVPERRAAGLAARAADVDLVVVGVESWPMQADGAVPGRNGRLLELALAEAPGARAVWFGTRNLVPWFDRYGDSSAWWALRQGRRLGVRVRVPVAGWPKAAARHAAARLMSRLLWSSEGYLPPRTTTQ